LFAQHLIYLTIYSLKQSVFGKPLILHELSIAYSIMHLKSLVKTNVIKYIANPEFIEIIKAFQDQVIKEEEGLKMNFDESFLLAID